MDKKEFQKEMLEKSDKIGIVLNEKQLNQFYEYMNLLLDWNEKINLTAITEPEEIILKHFIDSLTIAKYIKKGESLVDVGTGAGFPGIPLKIYREDISIMLLDSLNKRINFLNDVIERLDLKDITTIHSRVEEFGKNKKYREKFDIATSRAVANLATLSEYMLPLIKIGGKSICMKGPEISKEIENSKRAIKILGGRVEKIDEFELASTNNKRNIITILKIEKTPEKYPRKPGMPAKEPIK
ncbi:MAG: 16S rRNA (guanine(527)-N(7))-methyltransferase RsmG [Clostridia bacterium]|nr:16S rRNA (guanine(527)-N(7))-methyltransferase RsmG [Clostridia bacterium]